MDDLRSPRSREGGFWWMVIHAAIPVVITGLGFYAYESYQQQQERKQSAQLNAAQAEIDSRISNFAESHDAVIHWRKELSNRSIIDKLYSAELRPTVIRTDGRPLLFVAHVRDVDEENEGYLVSFEGRINIHTHFRLFLRCSPDVAHTVQSVPRHEENQFAVIARVNEVDSTIDETEKTEDYRYAVSAMHGEGVDVMYLGTYKGDLHEVFSAFKEPETRKRGKN